LPLLSHEKWYATKLSGGITKRAPLARALALDPEIVFLDEPTSGLDPIGARDFDELIATLQKSLELTVFMVTHDLGSLRTVYDRIAAIAGGKVIAIGTMETMLAAHTPWLHDYFRGVFGLGGFEAENTKPAHQQ
jgi:phospholipid/cholesterol/gamma-HCH transport system ATP-binding protein